MLDVEGGGRVPIAVTPLGRAFFFSARVAVTQSCQWARYTFANIPSVKTAAVAGAQRGPNPPLRHHHRPKGRGILLLFFFLTVTFPAVRGSDSI